MSDPHAPAAIAEAAGYRAGLAGESERANPYTSGSMRAAWAKGHEDGRREREQQGDGR